MIQEWEKLSTPTINEVSYIHRKVLDVVKLDLSSPTEKKRPVRVSVNERTRVRGLL